MSYLGIYRTLTFLDRNAARSDCDRRYGVACIWNFSINRVNVLRLKEWRSSLLQTLISTLFLFPVVVLCWYNIDIVW